MNKIKIENLKKVFKNNNEKIEIFNIEKLEIKENENIAIIGNSGSGKSTLLQLIAGLDEPTAGNVYFEGDSIKNTLKKDKIEIFKLKSSEKNKLRKNVFGFIYQKNFLLKDLNVIDNLLIVKNDKTKALELLKEVGLEGSENKYFNQLSGGERQRVSICRALMNDPSFIFADEPTGSLDYKSSKKIWDLFMKIKEKYNFTLILVTHDRELAKKCDKIYEMKQGKIKEILKLNM